jgi:hypothetical protein
VRFGIYYADHCAIRGRIFTFEGKAGLFASTPKDQFARSCSDSIHGHKGLPLRLKTGIQRLYDKQLSPLQRIILHRRHHCPNDTSKLHK